MGGHASTAFYEEIKQSDHIHVVFNPFRTLAPAPNTTLMRERHLIQCSITNQSHQGTLAYTYAALPSSPEVIHPTTEINSALQHSQENICSRNKDDSLIILCGDFNQLPMHPLNKYVTPRGVCIGPTHAGHNIDRIYATEDVDTVCRAIESTFNTKHRAVVAHTEPMKNTGKITSTHKFRQQTPGQHAALLVNI